MSGQRKGPALATTFSAEEVNALDALLRAVRSGRDATVIAQSAPITNAHRKFLKMRDKAQGGAS
jgi:cell division inhibitor SulA